MSNLGHTLFAFCAEAQKKADNCQVVGLYNIREWRQKPSNRNFTFSIGLCFSSTEEPISYDPRACTDLWKHSPRWRQTRLRFLSLAEIRGRRWHPMKLLPIFW